MVRATVPPPHPLPLPFLQAEPPNNGRSTGSGSALAAGENHSSSEKSLCPGPESPGWGPKMSAFVRVPRCHQSQGAAQKGAGAQGCADPCSRQPLGDEKHEFRGCPSHLSLPWTLAGWLYFKDGHLPHVHLWSQCNPIKIQLAAFDSKSQAWCPLSTDYFGVYLLRTGHSYITLVPPPQSGNEH